MVLELWTQAESTPGVTDTADDLRRAIAESPAHVLVAEVEGRLVGSSVNAVRKAASAAWPLPVAQ